MTSEADRLEAESRKYGSSVVMLLQLRSGRIAVLNAARNVWQIVSADELLSVLPLVPPPSEPPPRPLSPTVQRVLDIEVDL